MRGKTTVLSIVAVLVVMVSGCGIFGGGEKKVVIKLEGTDQLNKCGGPSANILNVRVLQLAGDTRIAKTPLDELWADPVGTLEGDLVDHTIRTIDVVLKPGETFDVPVALADRTTYLAVIGNFCLETDCWRWIKRRREIRDPVTLVFDEACVSEEGAEQEAGSRSEEE